MAEHAGKGKSGARLYPLWQYIVLRAWDLATWPRTARELKRAGFRHTGFMTWECGPEVCPRCGTRSCLEDARSGWYEAGDGA